ncbi:MAG: hypothetical protein PVF39_14535 [Desulfobacterales bacterium]|jgi:hypothetical protein
MQVDDFHLGAGILHPFDKMIEHQFGFTLPAGTGAGIKRQYFHGVLLVAPSLFCGPPVMKKPHSDVISYPV